MVVTAEAIATIIAVKEVPLVYGKGVGYGYLAKDSQGRYFHCNWKSFDDSSMTPTAMWGQCNEDGTFRDDLKDPLWWDAEQVYNLTLRNGQRAIPEGWEYCAEHSQLYKDRCSMCYFKRGPR